MYKIRMRLEGLASREAAANISDKDIEKLRDSIELAEFYIKRSDAEHLKELDSEFHKQIYSYCGSRTLETLLCELHRKVKRYRKSSVSNPERALEAVKEHREIYNAIAVHDGALAESLTARHIKNARNSIMKVCN